MNQQTRIKVLERDDYQCQFDKLFGISHLSDVECIEQKEAHHLTYIRYGHESEDDLITVCRRCHDILTSYIRMLRFTHKNMHLDNEMEDSHWPTVETRRTRNDRTEFQTNEHYPNADAQRSFKRPSKRVRPSLEEDIGDTK